MPGMRETRNLFRLKLQSKNWRNAIPEIISYGKKAIGPLFSFLPLDPCMRHRAAIAMGVTVARIAKKEPEAARNIIRNFMWHMNEDSGNIGWGIPEALAETLAASEPLAKEYSHILISYIMDLGHADNYCDHDVLRRSCFWSVGRLAQTWPNLAEKSRPWLIKGLSDKDIICRGMAAWALSQLPGDFMDVPLLLRVKNIPDETCEIFNGDAMKQTSVRKLAEIAINKLS